MVRNADWADKELGISQKLYDVLEELGRKESNFAGVGAVEKLVERICWSYIESHMVGHISESPFRFAVHTHFDEYFPSCVVLALRREDKDSDFVGKFEGLSSKEALLRVAKDGYGISEKEIQFI